MQLAAFLLATNTNSASVTDFMVSSKIPDRLFEYWLILPLHTFYFIFFRAFKLTY